jgi:hypothetical protein
VLPERQRRLDLGARDLLLLVAQQEAAWAIRPTAVRGSCMTVTGIRFGVSEAMARSSESHIAPLRFGRSAST